MNTIIVLNVRNLKIRKKYLPEWFNNCSRECFMYVLEKQNSKLVSSLAKYLYLTMHETLFI